jgi:hypothetical protein
MGQKLTELRSSLDLHKYDSEILKRSNSHAGSEKGTYATTVVCKTPSQALKIKDLASQVFENTDLYQKYSTVKERKASEHRVVDLVVSGLPSDAQPGHLKSISGVKHIVDATVDQDQIRNVCTGHGKIKVRLGEGEDIETVKQ